MDAAANLAGNNPAAAAAETAQHDSPAEPALVYVLDSTATQANTDKNPRSHVLIIDGVERAFAFQFGKPLGLPRHVAIKFLRHEAFKLTDKDGNRLEYRHRPKQPDELGAGEAFKLSADEVVARYDELSLSALYVRAAELPGGEQFASADKPDKAAMIAFIKKIKAQIAEANKEKQVTRDAAVELQDQDGTAGGGDETDFT